MRYFIIIAIWFMLGAVIGAEFAHAKTGMGISFGLNYTGLNLINTKKVGYSHFGLFELTDKEYGMYGITVGATPQFRFDKDYSRIQGIIPVFVGGGNADIDPTSKVKKKAGMFYGLGMGIRVRLVKSTRLEFVVRRQWSHITHTFNLTEVETQRNFGLISLTHAP